MHIVNHRLVADKGDKVAPFQPAHVVGSKIKPTLAVIHDTAGRLDKFNSVNWFTSDDCTTSAHFIVELDGTITQMVDCNRKAAHAGKSQYNGKQVGNSINSFSVGIEIVNPGCCGSDGRAWFHKKGEKGFAGLKRAKTAYHGDGWWMDYTPAQVEATTALCKALKDAYDIEAITTHWAVCVPVRRKVDPNPLFPLDQVRAAVFGAGKVPDDIPAPEVAVVKPPNVVKAGMESKTVWLAIVGAGVELGRQFKEMVNHGFEWAMWTVGILPDVTAEVKTTLSSGELMASWFKLNWHRMAIYITIACLLIAIGRHINDKRKLAVAQAEPAPEPTPSE